LLDAALDLIFHFIKRLHMGGLFVVHADNMKTVAALDQIAGGAFGEGECRLFEFSNGAASANPAERTAIFTAAGIFRIFLSQFWEVPPCLQLF